MKAAAILFAILFLTTPCEFAFAVEDGGRANGVDNSIYGELIKSFNQEVRDYMAAKRLADLIHPSEEKKDGAKEDRQDRRG